MSSTALYSSEAMPVKRAPNTTPPLLTNNTDTTEVLYCLRYRIIAFVPYRHTAGVTTVAPRNLSSLSRSLAFFNVEQSNAGNIFRQ